MLGCLGILSTRIGALSRSWTGQFFFRALHNVTQDKCFGHIFDGTLSFSCPKFKKKFGWSNFWRMNWLEFLLFPGVETILMKKKYSVSTKKV